MHSNWNTYILMCNMATLIMFAWLHLCLQGFNVYIYADMRDILTT